MKPTTRAKERADYGSRMLPVEQHAQKGKRARTFQRIFKRLWEARRELQQGLWQERIRQREELWQEKQALPAKRLWQAWLLYYQKTQTRASATRRLADISKTQSSNGNEHNDAEN